MLGATPCKNVERMRMVARSGYMHEVHIDTSCKKCRDGKDELEAIMFAVKKDPKKIGYISQNVFDGVRRMDKAAASKHVSEMKKQIQKAKADRARENA